MVKSLKDALYDIVNFLLRCVISLRYRVKVEGLKELEKIDFNDGKGILFLPNHSAEIDPVLVIVILRKFRPRPLVIDYFFYAKGIDFFMRLTKALPMPNMEAEVNPWKAKQVDKLLNKIKDGLDRGDNFIVYPSGKLKISGAEIIGGASFIHNLLAMVPEAHVVLVRTTGLWGSSFSRALTGQTPDFGKSLFNGLKTLLKNGIFFAPRRKVKIEISMPPADFPYGGTRLELNRYLEEWYNRHPAPGPEPLSLVSYSLWRKELPKVSIPLNNRDVSKVKVPEKIEQAVKAEIARIASSTPENIKKEMHLAVDLGLDSLDVAELYIFLDEHFQATNLPIGELQTVEDVMQAAAGAFKGRAAPNGHVKVPFKWPEERLRPLPSGPLGETLQESFLLMCDRMGDAISCTDAFTPILTYKKLKLAALVLSLKLKRLPGEYIGILLPSTVAVYIVILACLLAKKTPVMLNWTAGERALDHAAYLTKLQTVISSRRFLSRRDMGSLGSIDDLLVLLEELRPSISLKEKLKGVLLSRKKARHLLKKLDLADIKKDDNAVILFTSGTEALPKAVPLTHDNLLSNQRAALSRIALGDKDILYGILPPFHSFGFSVTGLLPLLYGIKACYAPDPNDSHGLAADIARWKPTLFCCAPSFVKALFRVANKEDLESIRFFVFGAEKTPPELFDFIKSMGPDHLMSEGYGITECGPIVAITPLGEPVKGVGQPLPEVELLIIHPDTAEIIPEPEKEGEVCIHGPNVFHGYLGSQLSPFIHLREKNWYRSGDMGYLDKEGNLYLTGRLKRFVKIGGEMVSLGGLEEELTKLFKEQKRISAEQEGPSIAIGVREKETEKPLIILFTTFDISKEEVNVLLQKSGYGRIVKVAEVRRVEQIPLTGTGKTHYRLLEEMIK